MGHSGKFHGQFFVHVNFRRMDASGTKTDFRILFSVHFMEGLGYLHLIYPLSFLKPPTLSQFHRPTKSRQTHVSNLTKATEAGNREQKKKTETNSMASCTI